MASISNRLHKDVSKLYSEPPPDVVANTKTSMTDDLSTLCVFFKGPDCTPFERRYFKLALRMPSDYPVTPPKVYFKTRIFHPNVEPSTGEVCVDTLKRDWDTSVDLNRILLTIRCLLIQPNPDSSLNEDAGKLIHEDYEQYERTSKLMAQVHGLTGKQIGLNEDAEDEENSVAMMMNSKRTTGSKDNGKVLANGSPNKVNKKVKSGLKRL